MWLTRNRTLILVLTILALLAVNACLPKPPSESGGGINITLYGFSIMKESLEKAIYPAFIAKVKESMAWIYALLPRSPDRKPSPTRFCRA